MAITVNFFQNLSDNRCMEKDLIPLGRELSCDVYDEKDVLDPVLIIDKNAFDIEHMNYCTITEFGRKYFITDVVPTAAETLMVSCHVDVLSTYAEDIRNCPLIAARSTNNVNYFLHDDMRLFNSYALNQYIDVDGGDVPNGDIGAPSTLILMTLGKGNT